jgi:YD repeat-containing protein
VSDGAAEIAASTLMPYAFLSLMLMLAAPPILDEHGFDVAGGPKGSGREPVARTPGAYESAGDPIDLGTGLYIRTSVDLELFDTVPVIFSRTYRTGDGLSRPFGMNTNHSYGSFLIGDSDALTWAALVLPDGGRIHYTRTSGGSGLSNAVFRHTETPTEYLNSVLSYDGHAWNIALQDGSSYTYPECAPELNKACTMSGYRDANGHWLRFVHDDRWNLRRIETEHDQWIELQYDDADRITRARSSARQEVRYQYDVGGRLVRVVGADGGVSTYGYDDRDQMVDIREPGVSVTNRYDAAGRCVHQDLRIQERGPANTMVERHDKFSFSYTTDTTGRIRVAEVVEPDGEIRRVMYDVTGYVTSDSSVEQGKSTSTGIVYERNDGTNTLQRVTVWCGPKQQVRVSIPLNTNDPRQLARTNDLNPDASLEALHALLQERCDSVLDSLGRGSRR